MAVFQAYCKTLRNYFVLQTTDAQFLNEVPIEILTLREIAKKTFTICWEGKIVYRGVHNATKYHRVIYENLNNK